MIISLRGIALAATISLALVPAAFAQDAMATDSMAADAMMSDDDLKLCLEQAAMITFPHVMETAAAACHDTHNGMGEDTMGGDAMAPDAMATDAMAPASN